MLSGELRIIAEPRVISLDEILVIDSSSIYNYKRNTTFCAMTKFVKLYIYHGAKRLLRVKIISRLLFALCTFFLLWTQ